MSWVKLNDWFSYGTVKIVTVRDWRLGGMHIGFTLAIIVYIIYNMITQGTYMIKAPPSAGSVRASVQFPTSMSNMSVPSYCTPDSWVDGCVFWTPEQIVYPYIGELNTLFITTRVTFVTSPPPSSCGDYLTNSTNSNCTLSQYSDVKNTRTSKTYYVANVEKLTIRVDHAVRVNYPVSFGTYRYDLLSALNMSGRLLSGCDGNEEKYLLDFNSSYRTAQRNAGRSTLDIMSVEALLNASNCKNPGSFDFSAPSKAEAAKPGESLRHSGMVISVPIWYTNAKDPSSASEINYRYVPAALVESEFKTIESITNADGSVTYVSRNGLRIIFSQGGVIGRFDFLTLILNLVAGLGLVAISSRVVEILMLYFLPKRDIYNAVKYEETIDLDGKVPKTVPRDGLTTDDDAKPHLGPRDSDQLFPQPGQISNVSRSDPVNMAYSIPVSDPHNQSSTSGPVQNIYPSSTVYVVPTVPSSHYGYGYAQR